MSAKNKTSSGIGLEIARILLEFEAERIRKAKQQPGQQQGQHSKGKSDDNSS